MNTGISVNSPFKLNVSNRKGEKGKKFVKSSKHEMEILLDDFSRSPIGPGSQNGFL
jgi:hypothetical protein